MLILVLLVKRFFWNKPEQLEQKNRALEQPHAPAALKNTLHRIKIHHPTQPNSLARWHQAWRRTPDFPGPAPLLSARG